MYFLFYNVRQSEHSWVSEIHWSNTGPKVFLQILSSRYYIYMTSKWNRFAQSYHTPRYGWNIAKVDVKHQSPNHNLIKIRCSLFICLLFFLETLTKIFIFDKTSDEKEKQMGKPIFILDLNFTDLHRKVWRYHWSGMVFRNHQSSKEKG